MKEPTHEIVHSQDEAIIRIQGHGTSEYRIRVENYGLIITAQYINSLGAISEDNLSVQPISKNEIAVFL